jgi:hypothetical protein
VTVTTPAEEPLVCPRGDEEEDEGVVNPYPVSFRTRKVSAPGRPGHDHADDGG